LRLPLGICAEEDSFLFRWKPGLASKRIATLLISISLSCWTSRMLETRTRFKEDCDCVAGKAHPQTGPIVGNQDSLQRGLRP